MSGPPAGWYPSQTDPNVQRYWDGQAWTDHYQPVDMARQPPPPTGAVGYSEIATSPPSPSRPWYKKKRFLIPGVLVLLLIVASALSGGDDSEPVETVAADTGDTSQESASGSEEPSGADDDEQNSEVEDSDADLGTIENPIPFGQPHTREAGMLGAEWTVSIDDVRTEGIGLDPIFAEEGETRSCVAVIGSATLDSLDSDELTSNPFSFPSIVLIADGSKVDSAVAECDTSALESEGLEWVLDISLAPGGSTTWYETFLVDGGVYETVAVESTVYRPG